MPPTGGGSETRRFEVGPWRSYVGKFFVLLDSIVICPLYKLTLRSAPSHSRTDGQSLLFTVKILSRSTPTCGGGCESFVFTGAGTHSRRPCILKMTVDAQLKYIASLVRTHDGHHSMQTLKPTAVWSNASKVRLTHVGTDSYLGVAVDNINGMSEQFWYLVLNVSSVTGIHYGGWWFEYQQWQKNYFFSKQCRPSLEPTYYSSQWVVAVTWPQREGWPLTFT
jgi:hypothetical protein